MAKTKEELNKLKVEYETLTAKLKELSDDELKLVTGGDNSFVVKEGDDIKNFHIYDGKVEDADFFKHKF